MSSPCIGVCELDPQAGLCRGCLRTMAEISDWPSLGEADRRRVLAQAAGRAIVPRR